MPLRITQGQATPYCLTYGSFSVIAAHSFGSGASQNGAITQQSDFAKKAARIGQGIHSTSQKLQKLAQLAKRTSKFDDPAQEINEVSTVVKQDIQALNVAIADLQTLSAKSTDGNKQSISHSHTVVDNLRTRLKDTTKDFKDVLTKRTEVLKSNQDRRNLFSIRADEGRFIGPHVTRVLQTMAESILASILHDGHTGCTACFLLYSNACLRISFSNATHGFDCMHVSWHAWLWRFRHSSGQTSLVSSIFCCNDDLLLAVSSCSIAICPSVIAVQASSVQSGLPVKLSRFL